MASRKPIVRQIAWLSVIPQLMLLACLILAAHLLGMKNPVLAGAAGYFILSLGLRRFVASAHRRGMSLFKQGRYQEAVPLFEASLEFFSEHRWIDRWRYLTLLSSSRISYREMALLNMAFCYGQIGQGYRAKNLYQQTLDEYPDSEMAAAALRMIESVEQGAHSGGNP